jgi:hypothetical protein
MTAVGRRAPTRRECVRRALVRRALARRALGVLVIGSCADFPEAVDPAFGLPDERVEAPTLARDVQPIFDRRCAFGGCHSAASRQGGLSLVAGASRGALVGRPARLSPGDTLVVAGSSSRSWLPRMIGDDAAARAGTSRMPLAAAPLTVNQRETIARWIDRGAPPD